jgi:hypothetical protein
MKKEGSLVKRKNTFEKNKKKTGLFRVFRVDPAGRAGLIVFVLLPVFHLTWIGLITGSTGCRINQLTQFEFNNYDTYNKTMKKDET